MMKRFGRFGRSRKGQVFIVMIIISVTVALIASWLILHNMFEGTSKNMYLGTYQSGIVDSLIDGDKTLLYTDDAASIASSEALLQYAHGKQRSSDLASGDAAGEDSDAYCGTYVYSLWNNDNKNCYPDPKYHDMDELISSHLGSITRPINQGADDERDAKEKYFDSILDKSIQYKYDYMPSIEGTQIIGNAQNPYTITIFRDEDVKSDENIQQYASSKNEWTGADGDIAGIPFIPAARSNYNILAGKKDIKYLVIHYTAGTTIASAMSRFTNSGEKASSNYIVGGAQDAYKIIEPVKDSDAAYHAGCYADQVYTDKCVYKFYDAATGKYSGAFCTDAKYSNINSQSIGIEVVNLGFDCEKSDTCKNEAVQKDNQYWQPYPDEQMRKVAELSAIIIKKYGIDRSNIIGHSDITKCKSDPGPAFDWNLFNKYLDEALQDMNKAQTDISGQSSQVSDTPCSNTGNIDWDISAATASGTDIVSDEMLKISMTIDNNGDCIAVKPKISITTGDKTMLKESFEKTGEYINVFKNTDGSSTIDVATCTFTTDPGVAYAERQKGNCVLAVPADGSLVKYVFTIKASDNSKDSGEKSASPLQVSVRKGQGESYKTSQTMGSTLAVSDTSNANIPPAILAKIKSTETNLKNLKVGKQTALDYITDKTKEEDISKELILGVITRESGGDPNLVGKDQDTGLGQVTPNTFNSVNFPSKCKWTDFRTDIKCQIDATIAVFKAKDNYRTDTKAYVDSVNAHCTDPQDRQKFLAYTDYSRTLRAYNGFGCGSSGDHDYVENVMPYVIGWGYSQTADATIKDEIQKGILGTYDIKPSFNVRLNFDLRLFGNLTEFVNITTKECANYEGEKTDCIKEHIKTFNDKVSSEYRSKGIDMELTTDCDYSDMAKAVNTFVEDVDDCASSQDDNCACDIHKPAQKTVVESITSSSDGTIVKYKNEDDALKNVSFDYPISENSKMLDKKFIGIDEMKIYKTGNQLKFEDSGFRTCTPNKNKYRMCLKTGYDYQIYHIDTKEISSANLIIPFAITIRDNVPPKPVEELKAVNKPHSKNSIILLWNKNPETDVVKYNIYLGDYASDFIGAVKDFKNNLHYKTLSSIQKNYLAYKSIDYNNAQCRLEQSSLTYYCIFEYDAVAMDGSSTKIELEKDTLYYINDTRQFLYVLDGRDVYNRLSDGVDKFIAVTAVDIDDNEIDNIDPKQKIKENQNMISIKPKDSLETGFIQWTGGPLVSSDTNSLSISWDPAPISIDGTIVENAARYSIYMNEGTCSEDDTYDISGSERIKDVDQTSYDIDISKESSGYYCIGISSVRTNEESDRLEFDKIFMKTVFIPMHLQPVVEVK